jgi:multicomponent Na+:H+ antiporter subunit F
VTAVYLVTLGLLGCAAAATPYRVARGPVMLDRAVALDVTTALAMCGIGAFAVFHDDYSALPILLVLLAMWLHRPGWETAGPLLLAGPAQVITVSVAAYIVVGRAGYLGDPPRDDGTALPPRR